MSLMTARGILSRSPRQDGLIGNYPGGGVPDVSPPWVTSALVQVPRPGLREDDVKNHLAHWLVAAGWTVEIAWGKAPGIDLIAKRSDATWIIEAKGAGSLQQCA
jgi:hypothetical protein